jgi:hypothetical protein
MVGAEFSDQLGVGLAKRRMDFIKIGWVSPNEDPYWRFE